MGSTIPGHLRAAGGPELDRINDPDERFPWGIFEKAHSEGLLRFGLPEAYGGTPVDEITQCLLMEEFGAADIGVGTHDRAVLELRRDSSTGWATTSTGTPSSGPTSTTPGPSTRSP